MKIEIYSDLVCPWCYIGERRLARALGELPRGSEIEVVFRPYQLDPNAPQDAVPLKDYLERRYGKESRRMLEHVSAVAGGEGISIAWDKALSANTRAAHRLMTFAEQEFGASVQRALADALFELHFTRGGNIADIDHLVEAAASVGIDGDRARAYLESGESDHELDAAFERARRLGIHAVPTFVIDGRYLLQGAQPVETFVKVLEEARSADAPLSPKG